MLASGILSAAPSPVYLWNFNRKVNADYTESNNATGKKLWLKAALRKNAGIKNSGALDCNLKSYNYAAELKMLWKEFSVDFRFKLDNPVNEKNGNTFMWYSVHSWGRSDFLFKITPKKELQAQFFTKDDETGKILLNYTVTTKPLDIQPGKFYSVRLSSVSGGNLKIWFDGVLVAARDKAKSFSDLTPGKEKYYPLLIIGGESRTAKPRFQLDGVIDNFAIYNKALDSAPVAAAPASSSNAFIPLTIPEKSTTGKFRVLDVDTQGGVVFTQADKVFRDHAATASIEVIGENMIVTFDCPVSPSHPVDKKPESYWSGELIEFFWSNDFAKGYYQFIYSASNGEKVANSWQPNGRRRAEWKTSFTAECKDTDYGFQVKMTIPCKDIEFDPASSQKVYRANFTRCGKSAGGRSTWANVGQDFHNFEGFGTIMQDLQSLTVTAVMTSCPFPDRCLSMSIASSRECGFPMTLSSQRTSVSEVTSISSASSCLWKPYDLPSESTSGIRSCGVSSSYTSSKVFPVSTVKSMSSPARSSFLLGELLPRIIFLPFVSISDAKLRILSE